MITPQYYNKLNPQQRWALREEYIDHQDGLCMHCGNPLYGFPTEEMRKAKINMKLFPKGFFNHPIHLQHNHVNGLTEGAVHSKCNAVLWEYHKR